MNEQTRLPRIVGKYESPAEQQSQNENLVPRKCWLKISELLVKPQLLERNQKIRLLVHVPYSNRVVKTQKIPIDDNILKALISNQNQAGFSEIPIDVTIVYEYKHNIQIEHPPMMVIEFEITSSILGRSKTGGNVAINMCDALQKPIKTQFILRKDSINTALIKGEVHSVSISKTFSSSFSHSASALTDSESELIVETPVITDSAILQMLRDKRVLICDDTTHEGQIMKQGLSLHDYVLPVTSDAPIHSLFQLASEQIPDESGPAKIIIAGDDSFAARVLNEFLAFRNRGQISQDSFRFFVVPLSEVRAELAQQLAEASPAYKASFLSPEWLKIFLVDSAVQNAAPLIASRIEQLFSGESKPVQVQGADALITTATDQFVAPMIVALEIGQRQRLQDAKTAADAIAVRATFTGGRAKGVNVKFHHLLCRSVGGRLLVEWRQVTNSNFIPMIQSLDKYSVEEGTQSATRVALSTAKGQAPLDIFVDGVPYRRVTMLTITMRDPSMAINLQTIL